MGASRLRFFIFSALASGVAVFPPVSFGQFSFKSLDIESRLSGIAGQGAALRTSLAGRQGEKKKEIVHMPELETLPDDALLGAFLGRVSLPERLDTVRGVLKVNLDGKEWGICGAADSQFKRKCLAFSSGGDLVLHPISKMGDLLGKGIRVDLGSNGVYQVKIAVNLWEALAEWSTIEASTVYIVPGGEKRKNGVALPVTGILQALTDKAYVFRLNGREFFLTCAVA